MGARQPVVLIVEDQAKTRESLNALIRHSCPALRSVVASDGATALAQFEAHQPVFVLVDKNLPDTNGFDLTRKIKERNPATLVAVISVESNAHLTAQALAAGAVSFICKENLFDQVVQLVRAAVTLTEWMRPDADMVTRPL